MLPAFDLAGMVSISPEGAAPLLADVVRLREIARQRLHESGKPMSVRRSDYGMNMVRGDAIAQHLDSVLAQPFPHHGAVHVAISRKLQQKSSIVTPMRHMVMHPSRKIPIRSCHKEHIPDSLSP